MLDRRAFLRGLASVALLGPLAREALRPFSIARAMRGEYSAPPYLPPADPGAGGFIVPEPYARQVIEELRALWNNVELQLQVEPSTTD